MNRGLQLFNRALEPEMFNDWTVIDKIFDDSFWSPVARSYEETKVDIKDYKDRVEVILDAPGYNKDDIKIKIQDGVMTISGEVKREKEDKDVKFLHREISNKSFTRNFRLGKDFKEDKIEAKEVDGLFVITVPKLEDSEKYKEVTIK